MVIYITIIIQWNLYGSISTAHSKSQKCCALFRGSLGKWVLKKTVRYLEVSLATLYNKYKYELIHITYCLFVQIILLIRWLLPIAYCYLLFSIYYFVFNDDGLGVSVETRPRKVVRSTAAGGGPIASHRRSPLRTPVCHHPFVNATTQVLMYTTSAPVLPLRRTYVCSSGVTVILIRFSVVFCSSG